MLVLKKIIPPFFFLFVFLVNFGNVFALDTTVTAYVNPTAPPLAPVITSPLNTEVTYTDSPNILVEGNSESFATIKVYVNSVYRGEVTAANGGLFSISTPLYLGQNIIYVTATNNLGTSPPSDTVEVFRDAPPAQPAQPSGVDESSQPVAEQTTPREPTGVDKRPSAPTIESINDGDKTSSYNIVVSGHAKGADSVEIYVNGGLVAKIFPDENGFYSALVALKKGDNFIEVYAVNKYGKSPPARVSIVVEDKEKDKSSVTTLYISPDYLEEILLIICYTLLAILALMSLKKRQKSFEYPKH